MPFLRLLLATVLLGAALCAPAGAAPATREAAQAAYERLVAATKVPAGWTGNADPAVCDVGTESEASRAATLEAVNLLRDFAGLAPVTFSEETNAAALAAALMMQAKGEVSHEPDPAWPCYTKTGADGAARSNLFGGLSGATAIVGYVEDREVASLGHRRWVLDPLGSVFGTGSTGDVNALYVVGAPPAEAAAPEVVAWPPGGHVPWNLVFDTWSMAVTGEVTGTPTVAVTEPGRPTVVQTGTVLEPGFGTGTTISWPMTIPPGERTVARDLTVTVDGLSVDGQARTFTYTVRAFPTTAAPVPAAPVPTTAPIAAPGAVPDVADGPVARSRKQAGLRRRMVVRRGKRLVVRMGIARAADGDRVRVTLEARAKARRYTARVRRGHVALRVRLAPRFRRAPLRVTVRYAGNDRLAPASQTIRFPRVR